MTARKPKLPWFKFYPTDWRGDAGLKMCGAAARGIWTEMLLVMSQAKPLGYLVAPDGSELTIKSFAQITGLSVAEIKAGTEELERNGVFSRSRERVIYSRKMLRDARKSRLQSKRRKAGWDAEKAKKSGTTENSGITGSLPRGQRPESRSKKESPSEPPKKTTVGVPPPRAKGTRLPPDWSPSQELRDYALTKGFTSDEVTAIAEEFATWWPAQPGAKGLKLDWNLTWMSWVQREEKRRGKTNTAGAAKRDARLANMARSYRAAVGDAGPE